MSFSRDRLAPTRMPDRRTRRVSPVVEPSLAGTTDAEGMTSRIRVDGEPMARAEDRAAQLDDARRDRCRVVEHEVDVHLRRIRRVGPPGRLGTRMLERERRGGVGAKEAFV